MGTKQRARPIIPASPGCLAGLPLSLCVALRLLWYLLTSVSLLRQLQAGGWVSRLGEREMASMRTLAFSVTMKFNLTV